MTHPARVHPTALGLTGPGAPPSIGLRDIIDVEKYTVAVKRAVDWSVLVQEWEAFLNTQIGDCTCASAANGKKIACAAVGQSFLVCNSDVQRMYEASGYRPGAAEPDGANPTDQGWTLEAAEQYMQTVGLLGTKDSPQPDIVTAVSVEPHDEEACQVACELFGGIHVAAELPANAQQQYREGRPWEWKPGPGSEPGSWGGHAMWEVRATLRGFAAYETWGGLQLVGPDWRTAYVVDKRALLWTDWEQTIPAQVRELGIVDFSRLKSLLPEVAA